MTSLYGNYRQNKFTDVWSDYASFRADLILTPFYAAATQSAPQKPLGENSLQVLYYLLYARYGNSVVASSDQNQFKAKLFSLIFQYGPTWEKRLDIQDKVRSLSEDDLLRGSKALWNHSFNPGTEPSTSTLDELPTINEQNTQQYKKSKMEAYSMLTELLETDVTEEFIGKFRKLFLVVVEPETPLWYISEGDDIL